MNNQDSFNLGDKKYSNNNNKLLAVVKDLQQIIDNSQEDITIKGIEDIITKIQTIINENKKNTELIKNQYLSLQNQLYELNKEFEKLNIIINMNNHELILKDGRYVGQVVKSLPEGNGIKCYLNGDRYEGDWKNGLREGKGIQYYNNEDRYEGEWKNGEREGKGIYYFNTDPWKGDKYEGDWIKGKRDGKGIHYYNNGDRYEGDWKDGLREGQGIYYYNNGDRELGNYYSDEPVGKHVKLMKNGEVKVEKY